MRHISSNSYQLNGYRERAKQGLKNLNIERVSHLNRPIIKQVLEIMQIDQDPYIGREQGICHRTVINKMVAEIYLGNSARCLSITYNCRAILFGRWIFCIAIHYRDNIGSNHS